MEKQLNQALVEAIQTYSFPWPNPITNGFFIRAAFLNTMMSTGGYAYPKKDLLTESLMNEKDFDRILKEFVDNKCLVTETDPINNETLYKLNFKSND